MLASALALTLGQAGAAADTFSFDLMSQNGDLTGYGKGPYASVTASLAKPNVNTATITIAGLTSGSYSYLLGSTGAVAVNVNAASFTVGTISGSGGPGTSGPYSSSIGTHPGANSESGYGIFNLKVTSSGGYSKSARSITFTVTNKGGTWNSAASVLIRNEKGHAAAAHVLVAQTVKGRLTNTNISGYVSTPEPSTLTVASLGTLAFLSYGLRRHLGA